MYRTGDVARTLPDGSIEFCGRIDHQVKIHGYRVELGEIEGALREHADVHDAVVLVREDDSGDKQLVAYVASASDASALREHLKAGLPQYMVPSAFVLLEKLPLTPNGKVDRQALAALPVESREPARDVVAPQTETEKTLVRIWGPLLKVENIGVDDDVFDLGAHSLMAMKALTQIRDAFGVSLELRNLFEHPTIGELAKAIDGLLWMTKANTQNQATSDREEVVL